MADDPAPPAEPAKPLPSIDDAPAMASEPVATDTVTTQPIAAAVATEAPPAAPEIPEMSADALASVDADLASAQESIDELLKQANFEDPSSLAGAEQAMQAQGFDLPNFQQVMQDAQVSSIDLLRDVELNVKIELGRSRMLVEDVLKLAEGSVVELDKLAGDPVDVFVNDRLVARGEVLVLNDNFCVLVNEIVASVKDEGL
jgi:flagellar motor switch protein FliN/FliY